MNLYAILYIKQQSRKKRHFHLLYKKRFHFGSVFVWGDYIGLYTNDSLDSPQNGLALKELSHKMVLNHFTYSL